MKTLPTFASSLALSALLLTAYAQTPTTPHDNHKLAKPGAANTSDRRAAAYKGPKVVQSSKALGHKMIQDSKPVDNMRVPIR